MRIVVSVLLSFVAVQANAAWTLNNDASSLSFVSTKAINIAEVHRFGHLEGGVSDSGKVMITVSLSSVDTGIEIRDDRMQEMLFETSEYATASLNASVNKADLDSLDVGESIATEVTGELTLHGQTVEVPFNVIIARTGNDRMLVTSKEPVVINAPTFGLAAGVEKLREVAGLPSISTAVPVSFVLSFDRS